MRPKSKTKYLPLSNFHAQCGLREDSRDLQRRPITWENDVIRRARLRGKTHQADPIHAWVFFDELRESSVRHPFRDYLQRVRCNADKRNDIWMPQVSPQNGALEERLGADRGHLADR